MEDTSPKNLISIITEKLADRPLLLSGIQKIALTIEKSGMSLEDCTLLARMTSQELADLSAEVPEIPLYFRLKRVQYKEKLLEVLHVQATTNKDVKIAMYLLEANFSDEYDPATKKAVAKSKSKDGDSGDLQKLMHMVRTTAPNSPVVEANTISPDELQSTKSDFDISHLVHGQ